MNVTVKLFAVLRDKAGVAELRLPLPVGASVSDAMEVVLQRHPELSPFAKRVAFAVNLSRVDGQTVLKDGDELALLPPVSGG
jgi:molybdopterin synthase sulfur carrier subunit